MSIFIQSLESLWKRITAKQTCYTSHVSYQQIRNQLYCKWLPFIVAAVLLALRKTAENKAHTAATKKKDTQ